MTVNLYEQVRDSLLSRIASGEFKAGDKIPTEELLCKEYGVSRITVRRAISELTAQMLISPRRGVGTVVMNRVTDRRVFRLSGFFGEKPGGGGSLSGAFLGGSLFFGGLTNGFNLEEGVSNLEEGVREQILTKLW